MLHLEPSELLLEKDLSPPTEQILKHLAGQVQGGGSQSTQTTRIERISKRLNVTKATSQITEFFAESKKRIKREMKKVPSEIILGDSDDDDDDERGLSASQKTDIVDTGEFASPRLEPVQSARKLIEKK
jgi:DNA mismatch repair protein MSH3